MIKIMKIDIKDKLMLAPLAGYTDTAFRKIAIKNGADIVYSEMVSARAIRHKDKKTKKMLEVDPWEKDNALVGIQLFGSAEEDLAYATEYVSGLDGVSLIDLNLGCPAPKIVNNGDGSALLKDSDKIYHLIRSMRDNTDHTLSAKIRLGIENMDNYLNVSQAIEEAGADFLIVHGRTREQQYEGLADWDKIQKVAKERKIPVVGNGDINSPEIAKKRLDQVDALMIGRGAIGAPWIFYQIKNYISTGEYKDISIDEIYKTMVEHLNLSAKLKGEPYGVLEMRKHIHKYLSGLEGSAKIRNEINKLIDKKDIIYCLDQYRVSIIDSKI